MRLSVAVMGHPARAVEVDRLLARLDDPDVTVAWDEGRGEWDTARRALLAGAQADSDRHLVLQDDALICRYLLPGLPEILRQTPVDAPVSLYLGGPRPEADRISRACDAATEAGCAWVTMRDCYWGVAIVYPTPFLPRLVARADRLIQLPEYDRRVSRWFVNEGLRTWYAWPSLVEHDDTVPSLLSHDRPGLVRRARRWVGAETSAVGLDYSGDVFHLADPKAAGPVQSEPRRLARRPEIHESDVVPG